MRAERERRESIIRAEGEKKSAILVAEGHKESVILEAEAAKESTIRSAEGKAEAILMVQKATAEGIRMLVEFNPSKEVIALKSLESFEAAADGKATKIIISSEIASIAGLASSFKELLKDHVE